MNIRVLYAFSAHVGKALDGVGIVEPMSVLVLIVALPLIGTTEV
ncbi:hypothetical protein [uncultured Cohaesibacter sp.]|nr:hypothetical protein [uncultured Cohaesibacter sp.]